MDVSFSSRTAGVYPLHEAVRRGCTTTVNDLLGQGVPVNQVDHDQVTPLHEACFHDHLECARLLLENGAMVNAANIDGATPICEASAAGSVRCILLLLQHGASVNPPLCLSSPLHEAALRDHLGCVEVLIEAGAKLNSSDCHFGTPLHVASMDNYWTCVEAMLRAGAAVNATKIHTSALHVAALADHVETTELLLQFGADTYARDNQGRTARQLAPAGSRTARLLQYHQVNPWKLSNICRLAIRKSLGPSRLLLIPTLGLPEVLRNFVAHQ